MTGTVAAEIRFEQNSICNPNYVYDDHKPLNLDGYITDEEWKDFIEKIEKTLEPAKQFKMSIFLISAIFILLYIIILISTLNVLADLKPSIIQLGVMIGINILFIFGLFRTERGLRGLAQRRLRKVLAEATETHSKLSFKMKQQDRGRSVFTFLEICITQPIAASGGWDEVHDGGVILSLEETVHSA